MKTDDLITAMAADGAIRQAPIGRSLISATALALLATLLVFLATLGWRPDIAAAVNTWRFDLKVAITALALLAALVDCLRLARPEGQHATGALGWTALSLLALAVAIELLTAPPATWGTRLVGTNAYLCLAAIPALAAVPFAMLMWTMKSAAPRSPSAAGATIGRLAGSLAAVLYATHCFDDSPLFVATWYPIAIAIVSVAGAWVGRRALAW